MLIGLGKMVKKVTSSLNLLASRIIGFTTVAGGGSSYYTTMQGSKTKGFVIPGPNGFNHIQYSVDGINWEDQYLPTFSLVADTITYGASGNNGQGSWIVFGQSLNSESHLFSSNDGIVWQKTIFPVYITDATYVYGTFFGVTQEGVLYTSTDGLTWSIEGDYSSVLVSASAKLVSFENQLYSSYASSRNLLIIYAAGTNNAIIKKLDLPAGQNSYSLEIPISGSLQGFAWNGNTLVALGYGDSSLAYANWTNPSNSEGSFTYLTNAWWSSVDTSAETGLDFAGPTHASNYQDSILVAGYPQNKLLSSSDGSSWSVVTKPEGDLFTANGVTFFADETNGLSRTTTGTVLETSTISGSDIKSIRAVLYVGGTPWNGSNKYTGGTYYLYGFDTQSRPIILTSTTEQSWTFIDHVPVVYSALRNVPAGYISTLQEVQVAIGNQGSEGAEVLAPVDIYTVPSGKTTSLYSLDIKNTSSYDVTFDLWIVPPGQTISPTNNELSDQLLSSNSTYSIPYHTFLTTDLTSGTRIVLLPSTVDVVEVKVYGTETLIPIKDFIGLEYRMMEAASAGYNLTRMYLNNTQPVPTVGTNITVSGNAQQALNTTYYVVAVENDTTYGASKSVILQPQAGNNVGSTYGLQTGGVWA